MQAPPAELRRYPWKGALLDSLPPDVRAATEADIKRVQAEARALVRAQALARAQQVTLSARNVSDFARVDRVEGFAVGDGVAKQFGSGFSATVRARYGIDDRDGKGTANVAWQSGNGFRVRAFGIRDFRDVGDVAERSGVVNSLAAQEFGSDYTDPYLVRGGGAGLDFTQASGLRWTLEGSYENQSALTVHATPVTGTFGPAVPVFGEQRCAIHGTCRSAGIGSGLGDARERARRASRNSCRRKLSLIVRPSAANSGRPARVAEREIERDCLARHSVSCQRRRPAWLHEDARDVSAPQDLVYFGGPVSAPGYDYHSLVSDMGFTQRIEWRHSDAVSSFSLGRFGHVPAQGTFAPYVHVVGLGHEPVRSATKSRRCVRHSRRHMPSLARRPLPVARRRLSSRHSTSSASTSRSGVARGGRWIFDVDVSRDSGASCRTASRA